MYEPKEEINIEGFKKLYQAEYDYSYDEKIDVNNYKLRDRNRNVEVIVDLENFIRQMYEAEKTNTKNSKFEEIRYL